MVKTFSSKFYEIELIAQVLGDLFPDEIEALKVEWKKKENALFVQMMKAALSKLMVEVLSDEQQECIQIFGEENLTDWERASSLAISIDEMQELYETAIDKLQRSKKSKAIQAAIAFLQPSKVTSLTCLMELQDLIGFEKLELLVNDQAIKLSRNDRILNAAERRALKDEAMLAEKALCAEAEEERKLKLLQESIANFELTQKTYNKLKNHGIEQIGDIVKLAKKDLFKIRNVGKTCADEIIWLIEKSLRLEFAS